jgi:uncharacterized protein (AIM24 family)
LQAPAPGQPAAWVASDVLHLPVDGELFVHPGALLAADGLEAEPARRRERGRLLDAPLGSGAAPFRRFVGVGGVWLAPPASGAELLVLSLEDDVLFLREERLVAFGDDLVWEAGRLPRDGLRLVQLRGTGRAVVVAGPQDLVALRLAEPARLVVDRSRLFGWIGRVVAQGIAPEGGRAPHVACEGEGVLLMFRHGQAEQPVHERPEPRDHGARGPHPRGALLHR